MNNFITNDDTKDLKNRLLELIGISKELKFLVGFFYFSGIKEIYQGLKENPNVILKVLVGMNIDRTNFRLLEYAEADPTASDTERSNDFLEDIKASLTHNDFDTQTFYEQISFFTELIRNNRLIVRKSREPNHAKIYLFSTTEIARQKLFITGSSNLTRPALTSQAEFNVEISDNGVGDAEAYFDSYWEDAIKISEVDEVKTALIKLIEKDTLVRKVSPYEAYAYALKGYLDSFKQEKISQSLPDLLEAKGYKPYRYQLDAVKQALSIIKENNGVIIADVVGLGKTIIACSVARELRKRGIILCPPGLIGDSNKKSGWKMYTEQFGLTDWEVRSVGDLENAAEFVRNVDDIGIVIIDEAHRFRNQDTRDYELLRNICRDKIVILLTATPFNNRPSDIFSLLKLFITPRKSSITLNNNLVARFRSYKTTFDQLSYIGRYGKSSDATKRAKAQAYYEALFGEPSIDYSKVKQRAHYLAEDIRDVITPITIRRNRLDLKNNPFYKDEVKNLSTIADPHEWFYELSADQSSFYDKILTTYFGSTEEGGRFTGAIYRPFNYESARDLENLSEKDNFDFIQQHQLYEFMRRLLVKRFESSFGSFKQSILKFKEITEHVLEFIEKTNQYILDRPLLEKIYSLNDDEIESHLQDYAVKLLNGDFPKNKRIYYLDKFAFKDKFLQDINSDLELFTKILEELRSMDLVKNDPKSKCLIENIRQMFNKPVKPNEPKRKVVIFSEYKDTVVHLEKTLNQAFKDRVLVIAGDLPLSKIQLVIKNFDASSKVQLDDYDILLTTDRLSEGYNLNRAGMVVNYDIPWNPVRVIQRVGRINRISKKVFSDLFIVNFFPTEKGAQLVKSREIASAKMFLIHNILGEDAKIFDIDETPSPAGLFHHITQNPEELEQESFYTQMLNRYARMIEAHPNLASDLENFPTRIKVAKAGEENELLVFFKKGRLYIQSIQYHAEDGTLPVPLSFEKALPKIECEYETEKCELSKDFWNNYLIAKQVTEEKEPHQSPRSVETQAINNLKTLLRKKDPKLSHHHTFLADLLSDILDYGTLSDYTLRRISNWETQNASHATKLEKEISALKLELGSDYLSQVKTDLKKTKEEIIIAIENQT